MTENGMSHSLHVDVYCPEARSSTNPGVRPPKSHENAQIKNYVDFEDE